MESAHGAVAQPQRLPWQHRGGDVKAGIRKAENGYIVEHGGVVSVANDLLEVFEILLEYFEKRSRYKYGSEYGKVELEIGEDDW